MLHIDKSHILNYDIKDKKSLFYSTAIRLFGSGIMTMFVPGLIYLNTNMNIQMFFLFYIISSATTIIIDQLLTIRLINNKGTKIGMLTGLPFLASYFISITFINQNIIFYWLSAITIGIFTSLFWTSFHIDLSQSNKEKNFGSRIAGLQIITIITSSIAPLLGGWLIENIGTNISLLISSLFILISGIPILTNYKKHEVENNFKSISFLTFFKKNIFSKYSLGFAAKGYSEMIAGIYWPLFLFLFFGSFTKVGIITGITTLIVSIILYIVGKLSDKKKENIIISISSLIQSTNWIAVGSIFVLGSFSRIIAILADIFHKITHNVNSTCISKKLYEKSITENIANMYNVILHEYSIHFFRIIYMGLFAIMYSIIPLDGIYLTIPFFVLAILTPLQILMYKKH